MATSPRSVGSDSSDLIRAQIVLSDDGPLAPGFVKLDRGGFIEKVGQAEKDTAIDYDVLAPGFIDLQVNGIGDIDVATADGSDWEKLDDLLLSQGVTTWCPTLVTSDPSARDAACKRVAAAMNRTTAPRPTIAGVHLEGPFIAVAGAHPEKYIRQSVDTTFSKEIHPVVRLVTLAPEIPGALEAIRELSEGGLLVSIGHSAASAEVTREAASAGARMVTHLGNAMSPFHQRNPGILGASLADDRLTVSLIADLEHVHADVIKLAFAAKPKDRVALVTDAVATRAGHVGSVVFAQAGEAYDRVGDVEPDDERAARLADGTLAGSALRMNRAVFNTVSTAGVSIADAVRAASTTPANLLGMKDRGAIAPGLRGDLVALRRSASYVVDAVWVKGEIVS